MGIFQCYECGCAENTALGFYHSRFSKRLTKPENYGKPFCSACAPVCWPSGEKCKDFKGAWHGVFKRTFLPKGSCFTNKVGNLEHKDSGLVGNELYTIHGSDKEI